MNLMFRKNFREGGTKSGGGTKMTSKVNRNQNKRSRDMGYGSMDTEPAHYRTHIFFSPSRTGGGNDFEGLIKSV